MSWTIASPDYHLGIIKGYLLAQSAPLAVCEAAEALHQAAMNSLKIEQAVSTPVEIYLPVIEPAVVEKPCSQTAEVVAERAATNEPEEVEPVASKAHREPVADLAAPKTRKPWSPEAREAAATRMKARHAEGGIKGLSKSQGPAEKASPARPFVEVPIAKLQTDHDDYAGKRDPGQELTEADWPDIKNMLEKQHRSIGRVASDYNVKYAVMQQFINRHPWKGNSSPGEVRAPSR